MRTPPREKLVGGQRSRTSTGKPCGPRGPPLFWPLVTVDPQSPAPHQASAPSPGLSLKDCQEPHLLDGHLPSLSLDWGSGWHLRAAAATGSASCQTLSKEVPQSHKYAEKHMLFRPPVGGGRRA